MREHRSPPAPNGPSSATAKRAGDLLFTMLAKVGFVMSRTGWRIFNVGAVLEVWALNRLNPLDMPHDAEKPAFTRAGGRV